MPRDTVDYVLRNIPRDLQDRCKLAALKHKTTIRRVLLVALLQFDEQNPDPLVCRCPPLPPDVEFPSINIFCPLHGSD